MSFRPSSLAPLAPEYVSSIVVGLTAGVTSTVLTGWAQVSDLGRAIIFLGSCLSGALFSYWAARSSSTAAAIGKSVVAGAVQANLAASALVFLAYKIDFALHISPARAYPGDLGSLAVIMLFAGSAVGSIVGLVYALVPTLVAHWRKSPSIANADRAMFASAIFAGIAAAIHARIVTDWAAWAPLLVLAFVVGSIALVRTTRRARFLGRVRAGREPRYRIEPADGRSVLYRIAEEDERETFYREAASRARDPEVIATL